MKNYLSFIKFSHTVFALPFALIGYFLAMGTESQIFQWNKFFLMLGCMVTARSAAMAFNRYIDRHIDAKNPRTQNREIPKGIISANVGLLYVMLNSAGFILLTYFINELCFFLSPVALFIVLFYSYTKRFTALCHFVLGAGLALAPIGSYLVLTGAFAIEPLLYSLAVFCWVSGFDIIYSLQDEGFDKAMNLHSVPTLLGVQKSILLAQVLHVLSLTFICIAAVMINAGFLHWIGVVTFALLLIYQHRLVKPNDLSRVNIAFMTTNGMASVLFSMLFLADYFINH
jgi:4-hydroxybenzoate polyprenyltransferase